MSDSSRNKDRAGGQPPPYFNSLFDPSGNPFFGQFAELASQWSRAASGAGIGLPFGGGIGDPMDPDRLELMRDTGLYLRDMRELAGLTTEELRDALDLQDVSLLEAAEDGRTALPFELVLRLSSLLARHDPTAFVMRLLRVHNPALWQLFEQWGLTRIPLQYERECEFLNIFRSHDEARRLSDAGFAEVLKFTRSAFEMALHFVAQQELADAAARGDRCDPDGPDSGELPPAKGRDDD